jgi:hypothetical protein
LDVGDVEMRPRMEGNQMFTIFAPKKHKGGGGHGSSPRPAPEKQPETQPSAQPDTQPESTGQ